MAKAEGAKGLLGFAEARARLLAGVELLGAESVALDQGAGRVLAESVLAPAPQPPFTYSAMDGYALAAASLAGEGPWRLPVEGESRAGLVPGPLGPAAACRISTGAELPLGADSVVPQEQVQRTGDSIELVDGVKRGQHVRRAGEDLEEGALALSTGTRLGAAQLGLLASLDLAEVVVSRRPRVSVLCTGSELRPPGSAAEAGKIPDSISLPLAVLARSAGAVARVVPHVADDAERTRSAVRDALGDAELLLTVGGVSVGDHDLVRPALEAEGVTLDFWKVAIKPGKPLAFGRHARGARVLALPGNPASALITFALFGMPLLRALQGDTASVPAPRALPIGAPFAHKAGRLELVRGRIEHGEAGVCFMPLHNQASGALTSLAWADALAFVPAEMGDVPEGAVLEVLRISEL